MADEAQTTTVTLHNPVGDNVHVDPNMINEVHFNAAQAPPGAHSTINLQGQLRSFRETPDEVAEIVKALVRLVKFHMEAYLPHRPPVVIYIGLKSIERLQEFPGHGTAVSVAGRAGRAFVIESIAEVRKLIADAGGSPDLLEIIPPGQLQELFNGGSGTV